MVYWRHGKILPVHVFGLHFLIRDFIPHHVVAVIVLFDFAGFDLFYIYALDYEASLLVGLYRRDAFSD
ncbi:MAG: hypothetical protein ACEQSB_04920, partial [Undibacterium sp.]